MEEKKDKGLKFIIKKWSMSNSINENIRKKYQDLIKNFQIKKSKVN